MIFNVHTWLPVTLFNLRPDQEIYRFNYSLMTSQLRRGGEKGQHIFENVNLNNVFWVCWKLCSALAQNTTTCFKPFAEV